MARREATVTPLQSLVLLNDPQFVEAARRARRARAARHPADATARNREAFRALIGRLPDESEAGILARMFDEQRRVVRAAPRRCGEGARASATPAPTPALPTASPWRRLTDGRQRDINFDEFVVLR